MFGICAVRNPSQTATGGYHKKWTRLEQERNRLISGVFDATPMGLMARFLLLIAMVLYGMAQSQPEPRVVEKTVEVFMNDEESKADFRLRAINEARREAVEEANGVSVKSQTIVENSQLVSDFVRAMSDGLLVRSEILEEKWITVGNDVGRRVRLRGWVTPPRVVHQDPNFNVKLTLDRKVLVPGDHLHLTIRSTQDAYIHIFYVGADGKLQALLPSSVHPAKFIRANTDLKFPSPEEEQSFQLTASLAANHLESTERMIVVATKQDVDLIGKDFREALPSFDAHDTGLIELLYRKLSALGDAQWVQGVEAYRIVAK